MNLLKIDNKLVALSTKSSQVYNITDNLIKHTIRKVILNNDRLAILTTTNLYYLYKLDDFILVDITDSLKSMVDINDIKFIVNHSAGCNNINIITTCDRVFTCNVKDHKVTKVKNVFKLHDDVIAVSDQGFGYIYMDYVKRYVVEECTSDNMLVQTCTLTRLPSNFITPYTFVYGKALIKNDPPKSSLIKAKNIHCAYNEYYYTKDNLVYTTDNNDWLKCYGNHKTDKHKYLNVRYFYKVSLDICRKIVTFIHDDDGIINDIAKYHYCAKNLGKYSNDTIGVVWSMGNHCMFDKYTRRIIGFVMLCYKHSVNKMFVPKGVLFMILGYVAK